MPSLDQLTALASGDDIPALLACCEEFELDLGHSTIAPEASLGVYKTHLIAYLLCQQLDNARFLWKRLPAEPRDADAELVALWGIGKALWVKEAAQAQAAMAAYSWSPPIIAGLVARLQREHLERTFGEMARCYSLISAEALARSESPRATQPSIPQRGAYIQLRARPSLPRAYDPTPLSRARARTHLTPVCARSAAAQLSACPLPASTRWPTPPTGPSTPSRVRTCQRRRRRPRGSRRCSSSWPD